MDAGRIRVHKRKSIFQTVMSAGRWHYHCRCGKRRLRYVAAFWAVLGASREPCLYLFYMGCWCAKHNEGLRIYILCEAAAGKIETFDLLVNREPA